MTYYQSTSSCSSSTSAISSYFRPLAQPALSSDYASTTEMFASPPSIQSCSDPILDLALSDAFSFEEGQYCLDCSPGPHKSPAVVERREMEVEDDLTDDDLHSMDCYEDDIGIINDNSICSAFTDHSLESCGYEEAKQQQSDSEEDLSYLDFFYEHYSTVLQDEGCPLAKNFNHLSIADQRRGAAVSTGIIKTENSDSCDVKFLETAPLKYVNRKTCLGQEEDDELTLAYRKVQDLSLDQLHYHHVQNTIIKPLYPRYRREALRDERVRECKARIWAEVCRRFMFLSKAMNQLPTYEAQREEFLEMFPDQADVEETHPVEFKYRVRFVRAIQIAHHKVNIPAHDNLLNFLRIGTMLEGSGEYYAVGSKHARNTGIRQTFIDRVTNTVRSTRVMHGKQVKRKEETSPLTILEDTNKKMKTMRTVGHKRQLTRLITE